MVKVVVSYNTILDYIIMVLDGCTGIVLLYQIFRMNVFSGALFTRAALGVLLIGMWGQDVTTTARRLGTPLGGGLQTIWAVKDIGISMLVFALAYTQFRARQISRYNAAPMTFDEDVEILPENDA